MKKVFLLSAGLILSIGSLFADSMTIDIDTALELLHRNNLDIQAAAYDVKVAERNKKTVWNAFLPTLGVTGSTTLMDNPAAASGIYGPDDARFNFNLGVSASLGINYALGSGIKNYILQYEAGEISYETAVKGLEMNTKIQFYSLLNMEEQIKIMAKGIDLAQKRYLQVQENYKNGLIPELEVLRTQVAYESQKPALSNMQTQYNNMLMGFKVMLGLDRTQEVALKGTLDTDTYNFDSENLIENYLGRSLTLKNMNKNLEILENTKKMSAQYAYTPMLSFSYSLTPMSYNPWADDYMSPEDPWNFQSDDGIGMGTFTIALSFSLDNYIPGSKKSVEMSNMKDQIEQLKLSIQKTALDSEVEVINTLAKLENSIEQLDANKLNVELARKAYEMTSEAYQLGTKELLDVESAQNDLLSAEAKVLGEQFNYLSSILNLEFTLNTSIEEILKNNE